MRIVTAPIVAWRVVDKVELGLMWWFRGLFRVSTFVVERCDDEHAWICASRATLILLALFVLTAMVVVPLLYVYVDIPMSNERAIVNASISAIVNPLRGDWGRMVIQAAADKNNPEWLLSAVRYAVYEANASVPTDLLFQTLEVLDLERVQQARTELAQLDERIADLDAAKQFKDRCIIFSLIILFIALLFGYALFVFLLFTTPAKCMRPVRSASQLALDELSYRQTCRGFKRRQAAVLSTTPLPPELVNLITTLESQSEPPTPID